MKGFDRLVQIMKRLRAPDGCPWDRKQTFDSLRAHILEESYELVDALSHRQEEGMDHVKEEAGDLAMQFVFVGCLAEEQGAFTLEDILEGVCDKLVRRHPHVFGDQSAKDDAEALRNWEAIKAEERKNKAAGEQGVLSGVPRALPSVVKAYRVQQKAASVGFDWPGGDQGPVLDKVAEELDEVRRAVAGEGNPAEELGDLLYVTVHLCRRLGVDPEAALEAANAKFMRRFAHVEARMREKGLAFEDCDLKMLDGWWDEAKGLEKSKS